MSMFNTATFDRCIDNNSYVFNRGWLPPLLILQSSYQNGPDLEVGHFSDFFNRGWLPPLLDFAVTPITKATFMYMGGSLFTECMAISAKLTKGKLLLYVMTGKAISNCISLSFVLKYCKCSTRHFFFILFFFTSTHVM